ncbi:TPA: hypothetical protein U2I61_000659 [Providencia rettgeri]|nr:hypothetical protein [Providencia rettgeri]
MAMKYSKAKCTKSEGKSPFVVGEIYRIFHSTDEDVAEVDSFSYGLTNNLEHNGKNCKLTFSII